MTEIRSHTDEYGRGYYAACSCGWAGEVWSSRDIARRDADRHTTTVHPPLAEQGALF